MNNKTDIKDSDMPWRHKVEKVIEELCTVSYLQFNGGRKRHKPYSIPFDAERLVGCLDRNDEEEAKAIMMFPYTGL